MDTEEVFISGFCRTINGTNTVCCEYEEIEGKRKLVFMDCVFEKCEHHAACLIYKEAREKEQTQAGASYQGK
ncbi:MAG: hypothetical protein IIY55_11035 [Blautia sp.]|nr:hypothetical protein [Blautia sp.]